MKAKLIFINQLGFIKLKALLCLAIFSLTTSCGDEAFIYDQAISSFDPDSVVSGDIIVVSGGNVVSTSSPYPLHKISLYSSTGVFKRFLYESSGASYLYGADLSADGNTLYFTVETTDRVDQVNLTNLFTSTYIINPLLSGNTMRAMATLSDGSVVVAESTASLEKFDASGDRVTTGFPFTVPSTIQSLRGISGDRFIVTHTGGNPDGPRVYSNAGALLHTMTGFPCGTNCDPSDVLELSDGRFVVSTLHSSADSLEPFDASFNYIGQLFQDSSVLNRPSALAEMPNGDIIACGLSFNTCEQLRITGSTAARVGSLPLISDTATIRQPTKVIVVP